MNPGMNLYSIATRVIRKSAYAYFSATSRVLDARGIWVATHAAGVPLFDSIQAIERNLYEKLGLDLSKYYVMIYTDNPLLVVERGTSGDQIEYNGGRYQLLSETDWKPQDDWAGVLAVRLNATVPP